MDNGLQHLIEIVRRRKSVRTYSGTPLSSIQRRIIDESISAARSPFGGNVCLHLVSLPEVGIFKPVTYGVIKGARDFLAMGFGDDDMSYLSAGYIMEQVVLDATARGLGTCWIAATFSGSVFDSAADMPEGMSVKIVSPVGSPAVKRSLFERAARVAVGSDKRKPFPSLFFEGDFSSPLCKEGRWTMPLEMLRLAPSSVNSQPWRAVVKADAVHFYYVDKGGLKFVDMGIGLRHFDAVCEAMEVNGGFVRASHPEPPRGLRYLISYVV